MESTILEEQIRAILDEFGISEYDTITWLYRNVWDIGDRFILKQCPELDEFEKSLWFSGFLLERQIPVRQYHRTTNGKYFSEGSSGRFSLMSKIKGSHIDPFERNSGETGYKLGQIVAVLHQALAVAEPPFEIYDADTIEELNGWIADEIKGKYIIKDDEIIKACLEREQLYKKLPRQIIHRDMHLQNLVFDGDRFAGYLDFDISQKNVRIFDLCYLASSMLVGNYADEERYRIWKDVFNGVLCGYNDILHLSEDEKAMIPLMIIMIELTFTAWYSKLSQVENAQSCAEMARWCYERIDQIEKAVVSSQSI